MKLTRRKFIGTTATAVVVAGMKAQGKVFGANERIRVCTIGFNGRGVYHLNALLAMKDDAEYVALCDVDEKVLAKGSKMVFDAQGRVPRLYKDIREVCLQKDIDAVTIATPNHWHSLGAIWAMQSGKDVYVEKPMSHNIFEGQQVMAAAKKYQRIVQHGTQSRSNATLIRDIKLIQDGFIGPIVESRGYVYKNGNRASIGRGALGPVPPNLDWFLWQGPARDRPFQINLTRPQKPGLFVHYDWHYFWEYGNGEIGNQGVHQMDIACWGHNRGMPTTVFSAGGRFGLDDDGQSPNTQATTFSYADGSIMTFEVRNLGSFEEADGGNCGNSFLGTKGYYVVGKGFFTYKETKKGPRESIPVPATTAQGPELAPFKHFLNAVRSRNLADVPMTPLDSHISCAHCHLGNIAYRARRSLAFDVKTERFLDNSQNVHLTREYRTGFEVPTLS